MSNTLVMRSGRRLEVTEYGDARGHPLFFFHGLIGSHHQASYIAEQARRQGLRVIAPNRPGVGKSEFTARATALDAVPDVEDLADALGIGEFSVLGLSGGTPLALAVLSRLGGRVRTTTVVSGMGPLRLAGALRGMRPPQRIALELYSRHPALARRVFLKMTHRFRSGPDRFLDRLIATWPPADRMVFRRREVYDLFMRDLHQVFTEGRAPESLSQVLTMFRNFGFALGGLPADRRVTLWHGLSDTIVPPVMAWAMARALPNCEAHFVPGGHFVAVEVAGQIVSRLRQLLDDPACPAS